MLRGCAGQCCAAACMGLCAELERPRFALDGKLAAACATPWSPSPCKLRFGVRQGPGTPYWISHCCWCCCRGERQSR